MTEFAFHDVIRRLCERGADEWSRRFSAPEHGELERQIGAQIATKTDVGKQIYGTEKRKLVPIPLSEETNKHIHSAFIILPTYKNDASGTNFAIVLLSKKRRPLAFRFEGPESIGDKHGFFHVQMCRGFPKEEMLIEISSLSHLEDFSDSVPSFPLPADSHHSLLIAALVSLFGAGQELMRIAIKWVADKDFLVAVQAYLSLLKSQAA
ncbi:hypothetical protein [Mesorhizobium carmichaelinearum]|uniref:hypothetical protein n=1 Tax=Mesorhizobium carmichaelinearum TaxID=1208188 RepID=UPI000BA2C8EB|nr:hypothetical protein [Mesorhizobium carmichaelinearum]